MDSKSLFCSGKRLKQAFALTPESEILFSDGCRALFLGLCEGMRYTPEPLLLCHGSISPNDDWQESENIQICPWNNIRGIDAMDGSKLRKAISPQELSSWRSALPRTQYSLPYVDVRDDNIVIMLSGRPYSERSQKRVGKQQGQLQTLYPEIRSVIPMPRTEPVAMNIEVFTTEAGQLPDVDRFAKPIMDAFKGVIYRDDKQVLSLKPRVFDVREAFATLECRTEPMALYEVDHVPVGNLFPLAKGIRDYYVIRIKHV
jgi:hypothetical protein